MKFGYFDDENKEYVITTPQTPYPWINYLGTQDFFSLISNTAGGYSFYKDAKLRRITRFRYNNVPLDLGGGRYFYLYDDGDFWSPGFMPVKKALDFYECRHGMGYTKIKGARKGIEVGITFFVPQDYNGEVHKVTVKNTGTMTREVKLFSFVEWCLWNIKSGVIIMLSIRLMHRSKGLTRTESHFLAHMAVLTRLRQSGQELAVILWRMAGRPLPPTALQSR